jgi:hypothetical protein
MISDNTTPPAATPDPDWKGLGSVGIGPVLAEHCVAEHHWHEDSDGTRWIGGNNGGFDIENKYGRTDAKTAWLGTGRRAGWLQFAAPNGGFDPLRVDFIAPVILYGVEVGFATTGGAAGRVTAHYEGSELWVIPVGVVNGLIEYGAKGRSSVPLDAIAAYKVTRDQTRNQTISR